ncbi:uncharacterized protein KY384_004975 [Bacidia gigantensis]|uniref:uncharacterized protein n=1 Tax=Bacidia gigantensis TaxID=2732470 RepID=UPI001D04820B|nr:uncharacterized protein KY384_004975 [Bacidia gigantensis]KAG8530472.1 hypothetical protein KY384_004975 [Bacidia gigantensis]
MSRNGFYGRSEAEFLKLIETAFLPQPQDTNQDTDEELSHDLLAEFLLVTGFEAGKLVKMHELGLASDYSWPSDARYGVLIQTVEDLALQGLLATKMIIERLSKLLFMASEEIDPDKGVSDYGMDNSSKVNMSLFGSSPDETSAQPTDVNSNKRSSLFDEDEPNTKASAGLFSDDTGTDDSPGVPETYVDAYDALNASEDGQAGKISLDGAKKMLDASRVPQSQQDTILKLIGGARDGGIARNEFNVLLALIGLSQEREEISLDSVDERRKNLPNPSLPYINQLRTAKVSETLDRTPSQKSRASPEERQTTSGSSPGRSRQMRKDSIENIEADPWASPAVSKTQTSAVYNEETPASGAITAAKPIRAGLADTARTTSAFTTHVDAPTPSEPLPNANGGLGSGAESGGGWGSYGTSGDDRPGLGGGSFGSEGDQSNSGGGGAGRALGGGRITNRGGEEFVTVNLLPEKEGMFLFQHHNYEVKSSRRGNAHQELAVWRKQATISVQEEFNSKALPPELEDSLPKNLGDTFDTVRDGVRLSADNYIGLCNLLERLTKRNQGIAADYLRFSQALTSLTEASRNTYAIDTNDVPLLNEGIGSTAKHMATSQSLLEDEARAWDAGVLEDFKKQRDSLVSVREMFDRRDRYARDNIPQLERRIEQNENKLRALMAGAGGKPGEQEKLELAVSNDKQSIIDQHARGVFIRECIRDELAYFQQSQYHVSRMHQDWSQERVKYAELQADNWRRLNDEVDHMPSGD